MASAFNLNQATPYKSPAHSSTGTRSNLEKLDLFLSSHCLTAYGFMFYFTPLQGFFFTFPSRYYFTIGHPKVFSLTRWSSLIHTGFHVPHATRDKNSFYLLSFKLPDFHRLWCRIQLLRLGKCTSLLFVILQKNRKEVLLGFCATTWPFKKITTSQINLNTRIF